MAAAGSAPPSARPISGRSRVRSTPSPRATRMKSVISAWSSLQNASARIESTIRRSPRANCRSKASCSRAMSARRPRSTCSMRSGTDVDPRGPDPGQRLARHRLLRAGRRHRSSDRRRPLPRCRDQDRRGLHRQGRRRLAGTARARLILSLDDASGQIAPDAWFFGDDARPAKALRRAKPRCALWALTRIRRSLR